MPMELEQALASPRSRRSKRTSPRAGGLTTLFLGALILAGFAGNDTSKAEVAAEAWSAVEAAAEKEQSIVLYCPASDLADAIIAGFTKTYPWASVKTVIAAPGAIASRAIMESKASAPTADVIIVPRGNQKALVDANVVQESEVPSDATMSEQYIDSTWRSHPVYVNPITLLYNTNSLAASDLPKNVYDLIDPKWKGKIAFDRPSNAATAADFLASPRNAWGDEKWMAWLNGLKANDIFLTPDGTSAYQAALRGEVQVAVQSANQIAAQPAGTPMAAAIYDDLVVFTQSVWLARGAEHPNAGRLFINWLISAEGQQVIADSGRVPALRTIPSPLGDILPPASEVTYAPADALDSFYADPDKYLSVFNEIWPN